MPIAGIMVLYWMFDLASRGSDPRVESVLPELVECGSLSTVFTGLTVCCGETLDSFFRKGAERLAP
jgi:hypothetical protein